MIDPMDSNVVEARYYDNSLGVIKFEGYDKHGKPRPVSEVQKEEAKKVLKEACEESA